LNLPIPLEAACDPSGLYLEAAGFARTPGWRAGFTTRLAGGDPQRVVRALGWDRAPVFRPRQVHGARVLVVRDGRETTPSPQEADGIATACRGVVLMVAAADCVPLILFDPRREAGAVLHAGWRGTRSGIAREGVRILVTEWGCRPEDLMALVGPCIGPCCYEVGPEVVEAFETAGHPVRDIARAEGESFHLDLPAANQRILESAGVRRESVLSLGLCTRCRGDLFPSYRREGPAAGRLLAFLGSAPP
jgi:polyphenol oxidase